MRSLQVEAIVRYGSAAGKSGWQSPSEEEALGKGTVVPQKLRLSIPYSSAV
jgi:hypothetical protein